MEKYTSHSHIFGSFGLLCKILPFYGNFEDWRFLMLILNKLTMVIWNKNEKAFRNLAKNTSIRILKYDLQLNKEFLNYLINSEVLLNHKICIELSKNSGIEEINLFKEFLAKWFKMKKYPIFKEILFSDTISSSYYLEPIYDLLKQMGQGQENILVSQWKLIKTNSMYKDKYVGKSVSKLIGSKFIKNIQEL